MLYAALSRFRFAIRVRTILLFTLLLPAAAGAQFPISGLFNPTGITTDLDGNLIVLSNLQGSLLLSKYSSDGVLLGQAPFSSGLDGSLATDPGSGLIFLLNSFGDVWLIDPTDLSTFFFFNVKSVPTDASSIYDVASQTTSAQSGLIQPRAAQTSYGDIAISRRNGNFNLYVSGLSVAFPFILRIPLVPNASGLLVPGTSDVILTSLASAAPNDNLARGVAVNQNGWVLTTLPFNLGPIGNSDFLYAFQEEKAPDKGGTLGVDHKRIFPSEFSSSRGMATDRLGKLYVATGIIGSVCGVGGILIFPDFASGLCIPLADQATSSPWDFATSPDGTAAYLIVRHFLNGAGQILRVDLRGAIFADVPFDHWARSSIEGIFRAGLTTGCGNARYCPSSQVSRAEMAVFLLRGIHDSAYTPPAATGGVFSDVPAGYWAAPWIEQLAEEGQTAGCGGGRYCPEQSVSRAEMAVFLLRAKHGPGFTPPPATGTVFADVPAGFWAAAWIERLAAEGITTGCGNGSYCPTNPVTRAEMAVFLARTFAIPTL
ncbi:MAG TPA: S-layer homology domain-containing protein [Thermoanaerobaculia bacterium]|nr:S-layer homology domain-containing protein [Thermoanaerobaculia bacterium]